MRWLPVVAGGLIGGVAGYAAGVIVACDWLYPGSNLCGIYAALGTGPLGLVVGAIAGWIYSRRKPDP